MRIEVMATAAAALQGWLLLMVCWPKTRSWRADLPLLAPLAVLLGLGSTSMIFLGASLAPISSGGLAGGVEAVVDLLLGYTVWLHYRGRPAVNRAPASNSGFAAVLTLVFVPASIACLVVAVRAFAGEPHGGWDGWAIWNMHARFLYRAGDAWPALLGAAPLAWTHLDYPMLLPASVARLWAFAGQESTAAGGVISILFGFGAVGVLVGALALLRGWLVALVAGLALLGTPFFVTFSGNQHADIPLAAYVVATMALAAVAIEARGESGLWGFAGMMAGLAAWTKNEGILFCGVVAVLSGVYLARQNAWRHAGVLAMGLLLALLPVALFKVALAPANDVMGASIGGRLGAILDGERHRLILAAVRQKVFAFGEWRLAPLVPMALALAGRGFGSTLRRAWLVVAIPGAMMAGYYVVYLLTPWSLAWHLETSLVRLMLQLWPAIILAWALLLRMPAASSALWATWFRRYPTPPRRLIFGINLGVAAALGAYFLGQKAPVELTAARVAGASVSVTAGSGWFDRESSGRRSWQWSGGRSVLELHAATPGRVGAVTLAFRIRALSSRAVLVRTGDRVLWSGVVEDHWQGVELPSIEVPAGITAIEFVSDSPPRVESADPGARALAFAVGDVRVR